MPMTLAVKPQEDYRLPDHWILHEHRPDDIFTTLHSTYVKRVISILKAAKARTVLEVGCGDGWNCGKMVEAGFKKVVGTDFVPRAITYASALAPGAEFTCGDLTSEEFNARFPDKFDAVALIEVIEHIPPAECVDAIRNIVSPLRSGGILVLTTPSENFPNDNIYHYQHFTEQKLTDIFEQAGGLDVLSIEGYGDVELERRHWQRMRFFDNRFYSIKPFKNWLNRRYAQSDLTSTSLQRSHGIIAVVKKR